MPDETVFATKAQMAGDMLEAAHNSGVLTGWVAPDDVYGGRANCVPGSVRWATATRSPYPPATMSPHRAAEDEGHHVLERVPKRAWMRLRYGHGTKDERF
ncbi:hypothetical protein AB0N93_36020 [Streptomyces sp. NPDC091267]|uniref:hypothetical protein n=1 Tax=Streptomyces sp. NPDC091267 TaxID=3155195 RepID=UPI00342863C1